MANYTITLDINGEDHEVKIADITKAICEQYNDNYPEIFTMFIKTMLKWGAGDDYGSDYVKMLLPLFKETIKMLPIETSPCEDHVLKAALAILKEQAEDGIRNWRW